MEFEVIVQPKKEVLDPEGRAIHRTLIQIGHTALAEVRVSKRFILVLDPAACPADPLAEATAIAHTHLANPVAETFQVTRLS